MRKKLNNLVKGDYVLASKWSDGDPQDAWCIGFFEEYKEEWERYIIVDNEGKPFRANGYRRAKKISYQRGAWMLGHKEMIEQSSRSVWYWVRHSIKDYEKTK